MESPIVEDSEVDVGSVNDELLEGCTENKKKPNPRPFTIESLIGNRGKVDITESSPQSYEDDERQRELLYQQHCLATNALPGKNIIIYALIEKNKIKSG